MGVTVGDDLRINGNLFFGEDADTTYGGYLSKQSSSTHAISMKVKDDEGGFNIYQVWGNAGEASLSFEAVDEAIKLYYAGSEKLKTTSNGIEVTGTGIFSNDISTTNGILQIQKFSNTTGTTGTTLLELNHWVGTNTTTGDLSQQKTFIDFNLRDSNNNEYPRSV